MAVNLFTPSTPLGSDDINAVTGFRVVCAISGAGNGQVRATFAASSTTGLATHNCSIGTSNGIASQTTAIPVELLFGGSSGFSIAAGQTITSDFVNFGINPGDSLVVIADNGTPGGNRFNNGGETNCNTYFSGSFSYNLSNPGGFTLLSNTDYGVVAIETNDPPVSDLRLAASEW